ncbi:MAG: hypothetical protein DRQ88_11530 [Epsilonproteobacteria bacterium]|nr:MAG: hypothetical protein DRQ88_11530 [Campylobacterota bacterium]
METRKPRITFIAAPFDGTYEDGAEFLLKVSEKLKEDFHLSYVTMFKTIHDIFKSKGVGCTYLPDKLGDYYLPTGLPHPYRATELHQKHLTAIEEKYGCCVEEILVGDYDQDHSNRREAMENLIKTFWFWEEHIREQKPEYIIGSGQRYINLIAHTLCKKRDTKFLVMSPSPFPNTFYLTEDLRGRFPELNQQVELNYGAELSNAEEETAKRYIKSIINTDKRYFQPDSTPHLNAAKIKFFLGRAHKSFFIEQLRTPYSKPWRGAYNYALKMIRSKVAKTIYSKPDYTEKYIFFPLHVEWDSPILVWNPLFINQLFLIKIIARSLPSDTTLYVKEHISDIGGTPLTQLKKIQDTPKVKLINPQEDSHKLIKNSEIVLVIAGTAGWEGVLMEKPVISVGNTYYSKLTWNVRDLTQLQDTIKKARKGTKADTEEVYKFIAAFQKRINPGNISFTQLYYSNKSNREQMLSEENIEKVAEGIRRGLEGLNNGG